MIVHSYYEEDPRVRREAEALVARGRPVDVIALRLPGEAATARSTASGSGGSTSSAIRAPACGSTCASTLSSWSGPAGPRCGPIAADATRVVQVHSLPDFLVFAALPLKLAGAPVILDLHEAMPEFFRTRFPNVRSPLVHRALLLQERLSIAFADRVLSVNELMADRLLGLGIDPAKLTIVPNSPNLELFDAARIRAGHSEPTARCGSSTPGRSPRPTSSRSRSTRVGRLAADRPDSTSVSTSTVAATARPSCATRAAASGSANG